MLKAQVFALGAQVLEWFLPHRCFVCQEILKGVSGLCHECWVQVTFISDPCCFICGVPFDFEIERAMSCLSCLKDRPLYHKARAPVIYEGPMRELILRFKHADGTYMAPVLLGGWSGRVKS